MGEGRKGGRKEGRKEGRREGGKEGGKEKTVKERKKRENFFMEGKEGRVASGGRSRSEDEFARVVARHVEVGQHLARPRRHDRRTHDALVDAHHEQQHCRADRKQKKHDQHGKKKTPRRRTRRLPRSSEESVKKRWL